ncbi:hypothetical protein B296_00055685, partial [Ensete ventricosum]
EAEEKKKSLRMADQRWEMSIHRCCPQPPPVLSLAATSDNCERLAKHSCCVADNLTRDLLHRLFADGYRADVSVYTNDGIILAHASILVRPLPPIFPVENRSTVFFWLVRRFFVVNRAWLRR